MADVTNFKQLLADLQTPTANKEQTLKNIGVEFSKLQKPDVKDILKGNKLLITLAQVLDANIKNWLHEFPDWVYEFLTTFFPYRGETDIFPTDQMRTLIHSFRNYIVHRGYGAMHGLHVIAAFASAQPILVLEDELFHVIKKEVTRTNFRVFFANLASGGFEPGQKKIIDDKEFILQLLSLTETVESVWDLFANIAQHPDAKTLLPTKEIIPKASVSTYVRCSDVCTLLCSDDDLKTVALSAGWIESQAELLNSLLTQGRALRHKVSYSLLAIILPIANLSVVETYKDELGKKAMKLLLQVLLDELLDIGVIQKNLTRSRQEASRAIWNLAYLESNCKLIKEGNFIEKLIQESKKTHDHIIKQNINGILAMCKAPGFGLGHTAEELAARTETKKGHVMISYNWGNQEVVKRIAHSLKDHGYAVWLDIDHMEGSTLGAMAEAVEGATVVLLCMSQKYKDSPNCRLEGEYCVNTKTPFIPLMMQKAYKPDGWLGITLGAKLWYDFTDEHNWEGKIQTLIKALGDRGKGGNNNDNNQFVVPTAHNQVMGWNLQDMLKWMQEEKIEHHYETFKKHKFDGHALMELKALHTPQQPTFFKDICKELGILEIGEILRLSAAIRRL